jgi:Uma2 family endonuclease
MNIELRRAMTVTEFLDWAEAQPEQPRAELINGQVVRMASERVVHNRIKGAAYNALRRALAEPGLTGEVFTDGMTVPIEPYTAYEPDATLRLGELLPPTARTVPDPVVVVEVISPTSVHSDTTAKPSGYFKLPSVRHYLVIDPDARTVTHHARAADGSIAARTLSDGTVRLDPPGLTIVVADLIG